MANLSCGAWTVYAARRGGEILGELEYASGTCGRELDEISSAQIQIGTSGFANDSCCALLASLNEWEHELVLYRDGEFAWAGPITNIGPATLTGLTVAARDLGQWWERRVLHEDHVYVDVDLADIFAAYVVDAMTPDTSPGITVVPGATGILGTRSVRASEYRRAADELRELSRTGLDFTFVGRSVLIGGVEVPTAPIARIAALELIADPRLEGNGLALATKAYVVGANSGITGEPIVGTAGGFDERYGLVEQVYPEPAIADQSSADVAAETRVALAGTSPKTFNARISEQAPIDFASLVPGARVEATLACGCRELDEVMRLRSVGVTFGPGSEAVAVTLEPIGTETS